MRKTIFCFAVFMMLATDVMATSYTVTLSKDRLRHAEVVARLNPVDGRISLSRNARDTGLYHGWATFIHEIEAFDSNNNAVELEYSAGGIWQLVDHDGSPVTIRYRMLLQHDRFPNDPGDDELAWARDWGVMWTGRALFLEGADAEKIKVEFVLPESWNVSTPWPRPELDTFTFSVPGYDDLLNSAFIAGEYEETVLGDPASPQAIIALGGEAVAASELVRGLVGLGLEEFTRLFGSGPAKQLLLVAVDGSFWGGGVMGSTISMIQGGPLDENTTPMLAYITTHEMFHLWNSNFNIASLEDSDALQWFGEGAAEYYTWLTFLGTGMVDESAFLGELGKRYGSFMASRTDRSMSGVGPDKLDHYDLIYSGGMMATLALDLAVRAGSENSSSMGDVLKAIQSGYGPLASGVLEADQLPVIVKEVTGVDVSVIFEQYIFGNVELPMSEFLALAGLELSAGAEEGTYRITLSDSRSESQVSVWTGLVGSG